MALAISSEATGLPPGELISKTIAFTLGLLSASLIRSTISREFATSENRSSSAVVITPSMGMTATVAEPSTGISESADINVIRPANMRLSRARTNRTTKTITQRLMLPSWAGSGYVGIVCFITIFSLCCIKDQLFIYLLEQPFDFRSHPWETLGGHKA